MPASKPYVRLEKNAQKIVKAFGQRNHKNLNLSLAQLVNALILQYSAMIEQQTLNPLDK